MDIGKQILQRRKEQHITQKQLADAVGVTAAAVSKWETGEANPDITLIAPIARYLKTTTDKLLDFTAQLGEEQVQKMAESIQDTFRREGHRAGMEACKKAVCTYPENLYLRLKLAGMVTAHLLSLSGAERTEENHEAYIRYALKILEPVLSQRGNEYRVQANTIAASYEMMLGNYEKAQSYLKEIPRTEVDVDTLYTTLYLCQENWALAGERARNNIAGYGRLMMMALGALMASCKGQKDMAGLEKVALQYNRLESVLGFVDGLGHYHCISIYLKQGRNREAEEELEALVEAQDCFIRSMANRNNQELLNRNMRLKPEILVRLTENYLELLEKDETCLGLHSAAGYPAALGRLKALNTWLTGEVEREEIK